MASDFSVAWQCLSKRTKGFYCLEEWKGEHGISSQEITSPLREQSSLLVDNFSPGGQI
jgi:hypothetical protein